MKLLNFVRRKLVENQWLTLLEDRYDLPNGAPCRYYHALQSDAVMAIALDTAGAEMATWIVRQYRHPIGQDIWQFPMGGFDSAAENPVAAARAELEEEAGVVAGEITLMGSFFANPGFTNQRVHVCLTSDVISCGATKLESSEFGLIAKRVPIAAIPAMIESGEMGDAWGISGLHYLQKFLSSPP